MAGGIAILLMAAIGVGYFLYQKFRSGVRGRIMTDGRERLTNTLNGLLQRRNQNTAGRARQAAPTYTQDGNRAAVLANNPQLNRQLVNRPLVPASRHNITETGPMVYFANDRHGRPDKEYRFNYKKVGSGWRAYILRMPNLRGRSDGSGTIHRLYDYDGYYICWDSQVNTLKDMQIISRRWADNIQEYISTGRFG